jgi:hypothetical protein
VNVGARLCSAAGRGEIILSDAVLERVPDPPPVEAVGHVELKGVSRTLTLWRILEPAAVTAARVATAHQAAANADGGGTGVPGQESESESLRSGQPG